MGISALYALAQRGCKVIGIDRFEPGHHLGSSFGESRIIRMAYYEDPVYVPLLRLAYKAWKRLESLTGEHILTITGILEAGIEAAALVEGSLRSAREHDIPHEVLLPAQVNKRFPAFSIPPDWKCLFQPDAGILQPEKAIQLFVKSASNSVRPLRWAHESRGCCRWVATLKFTSSPGRQLTRVPLWSLSVRGFKNSFPSLGPS